MPEKTSIWKKGLKKLRPYLTRTKIPLMLLLLAVVILSVYLLVQIIICLRNGQSAGGLGVLLLLCYCTGCIIALFIKEFPKPQDACEEPPLNIPAAQTKKSNQRATGGSETEYEEIEMTELQPRMGVSTDPDPSTSADFPRERGRMRSSGGRDSVSNVNETKLVPKRAPNPFLESITEDSLSSDSAEGVSHPRKSSNAPGNLEKSTRKVSWQHNLNGSAAGNGSGASSSAGGRREASADNFEKSSNSPSQKSPSEQNGFFPSSNDDSEDDLELYLPINPQSKKSKKKSKVKYRIKEDTE